MASFSRFVGAIVPFAYRSPTAIASASQAARTIPKKLEPITKRVGTPLQSCDRSIQHPLPIQKKVQRKHLANHPAIEQACRRSFATLSPNKSYPYPYPPSPEGVNKFTGLTAAFYDCLKGEVPEEDVNFYHKLTKDQDKVLVIGSGTGRLLLALSQRGLKMDGIEPSKTMREICETKALQNQQEVRLYSKYMENFLLDTRYDSIFVPEETFMYILNEKTALNTLKNMLDHLNPGGQLVIDLLLPPMDCWGEPITSYQHTISRELGGNFKGMTVSCEIKHQWNLIRKFRKEVQTIKISQQEEPLQCQIDESKIRSYSVLEFINLLNQAGFTDVKVARFVPKENKMTFQAKKAADLFDKGKED